MTLSKKVVLLGHFGVGKTSIFRRFIENEFSETYKTTIGVQIKKKDVTLANGQTVTLILWDTEGYATIDEARRIYLLGAHAILYVFDLVRNDTYQEIYKEIGELEEEFDHVPIRKIGNKVDLVNSSSIHLPLREAKIKPDILTSAKDNINIQNLFSDLTHDIF